MRFLTSLAIFGLLALAVALPRGTNDPPPTLEEALNDAANLASDTVAAVDINAVGQAVESQVNLVGQVISNQTDPNANAPAPGAASSFTQNSFFMAFAVVGVVLSSIGWI